MPLFISYPPRSVVAPIEEDEYNQIVEATIDVTKNKVPIYVGVSGNSTRKVMDQIKNLNSTTSQGTLLPPHTTIFHRRRAYLNISPSSRMPLTSRF